MLGLCGRDVLYSSRGLNKLDMQRVSVKLHLTCGERSFDELHLQRRIFWARWSHVRSVRARKVQGVKRIGRVHGLRGRDVFFIYWCSSVHQLWSRDLFDRIRGLSKLDMQRLSVKLQLACGEHSFDELHLQRRINWAERRPVRSVRGRKVQGVDRKCYLLELHSRDVLYRSRGLSKLELQRLYVKLQLTCGERSFDELHLQRRIACRERMHLQRRMEETRARGFQPVGSRCDSVQFTVCR